MPSSVFKQVTQDPPPDTNTTIFGSYGAETKEIQPQDHMRPDSDAAEEASLSSKVDSFVRRTPSKKDSFVRRTPSTGLSINLCVHA